MPQFAVHSFNRIRFCHGMVTFWQEILISMPKIGVKMLNIERFYLVIEIFSCFDTTTTPLNGNDAPANSVNSQPNPEFLPRFLDIMVQFVHFYDLNVGFLSHRLKVNGLYNFASLSNPFQNSHIAHT